MKSCQLTMPQPPILSQPLRQLKWRHRRRSLVACGSRDGFAGLLIHRGIVRRMPVAASGWVEEKLWGTMRRRGASKALHHFKKTMSLTSQPHLQLRLLITATVDRSWRRRETIYQNPPGRMSALQIIALSRAHRQRQPIFQLRRPSFAFLAEGRNLRSRCFRCRIFLRKAKIQTCRQCLLCPARLWSCRNLRRQPQPRLHANPVLGHHDHNMIEDLALAIAKQRHSLCPPLLTVVADPVHRRQALSFGQDQLTLAGHPPPGLMRGLEADRRQ
jgi:hypothetical protein